VAPQKLRRHGRKQPDRPPMLAAIVVEGHDISLRTSDVRAHITAK
jgi:hypothetical protein